MLDRLDERLLARVQQNAKINAELLGAELGLSVAAVQRRLKRMRDEGIIEREVAVVDPVAAGFTMRFVVSVELERESAELLDAFQRKCEQNRHVQQCYYVTGQADFFLIVLARDMAHYELITADLFAADPKVKRFQTSVVMRRAKSGQELPLEP